MTNNKEEYYKSMIIEYLNLDPIDVDSKITR
jgi:hypothetical protein